MKPTFSSSRQTGSSLVLTLLATGVLAISLAAMMRLSTFTVHQAHNRQDWNEAFYHAENALRWGAQMIADAPSPTSPLGQYAACAGTLGLPYLTALVGQTGNRFENAWVTVDQGNGLPSGIYRVTASSQVGERVRTLQAIVHKNPPSEIFDYEYFLNNWGWWWGSSITGHGDNRTNWDFDFRHNPTVNGSILANGAICENMVPVNPFAGSVPFKGLAASDPLAYVHPGAPRLPMPNLLDFGYYEGRAMAQNGRLYVGGDLVVSGVHTNEDQPGIYLVGTDDQPIEIQGPVVIPGDVVIKGKVTGQGTLYVGGNLYVAGDLTYRNGPEFSSPPATMTPSQRDEWVANNRDRDLVAYAVRKSIFAGDVNSSNWRQHCYDASGYGLKNVGDESQLGADGIRNTGDDGVLYLDTTGDGVPDSAWYDANGNGIVDGNYHYETDIQMTTERAGQINGYPVAAGDTPASYSTVGSNDMNRLDGIFYTNHAAGMRLDKANTVINGSLISRDEAIVFRSTLRLVYDARVHSRYSKDPNTYIDLQLPVANLIRMEQFAEISPIAGFCPAL
jgi:hypothetical protein